MAEKSHLTLLSLLDKHEKQILEDWLAEQARAGGAGSERETDAMEHSARFLKELRQAADSGRYDNIHAPAWDSTREILETVSRTRALRGSTPSQTATFIFSLKAPLFKLLRRECRDDADRLATETWAITEILDKLGLYTTEVFQKSREEIIARQQQEMLELSTPVVRLWQGIVALPLIGTLDSNRTQIVMESLLEQIVSTGAEIAIIDITGVPTVDTLVAQHLLKTVAAARLMGADCIISGVRAQIAQTIVHLGVELSVVSKATMASAFELALRKLNKAVVTREGKRPTE
jgi:rsbT co-antagonist protein RsbR